MTVALVTGPSASTDAVVAALVEAFARSLLDGQAGPGVRITLLPGRPSPSEIAVAAARTPGMTPEMISSLADLEPERSFTGWRDEVMAIWGDEAGGMATPRLS